MKICPYCKQPMENPLGQYYFCKNDCDLKLKKIPEMTSKTTEPLRALGEASKEAAASIRAATATLEKIAAFRLGESVKLTEEGNAEWSATWGSDGQIDPDSYPYPYQIGDAGKVISITSADVTVKMDNPNHRWWIRLAPIKIHTWFERV